MLAERLPNPSGEPMKFVDISLPVYGSDGELAGILACHLSWGWADEVRRALLEPIQQRRNVEFLVLGSDHSVLLGPSHLIGQKLSLPSLDQPIAKTGRWAVEHWQDGQEYVTGLARSHGYQDYAGLGWIVVARQGLDEAYAPVREVSRYIALWGAAARRRVVRNKFPPYLNQALADRVVTVGLGDRNTEIDRRRCRQIAVRHHVGHLRIDCLLKIQQVELARRLPFARLSALEDQGDRESAREGGRVQPARS